MSDRSDDIQSAFRLNLEQQKNRAKDLLRAVRTNDPAALARVKAIQASRFQSPSDLKLADAQFVIARELRFSSWADLKAHVTAMHRERAAAIAKTMPLDRDMKTLHIRCGSDIQQTLIDAGFEGDFLEHSNPYCQGPVTKAPGNLEQRARFITGAYGNPLGLTYESVRARLAEEDRRLAASADEYERVVLWMEHDSYDQLVLIHTLAHYAHTKRPRVLELVDVNHFPGAVRFIGLGQLPREALRLLWPRRSAVTPEQLTLAANAWDALNEDDPRALATLMRAGADALPNLAGALHRHLRELPSIENGLGLTQQLVLQVLAAGEVTLNRAFGRVNGELDPRPWLGDLMFFNIVEDMERAVERVFDRISAQGENRFQDRLAITPLGRDVLNGDRDWLSLQPPLRWVGGVCIRPGTNVWRWDETRRKPVLS